MFCTLALARFLALPVPDVLTAEIAAARPTFDDRVLFVAGLGSIENTVVRRIDLAGALAFGDEHRRVYLDHGFDLVELHPAAPAVRAERVRALLRELSA